MRRKARSHRTPQRDGARWGQRGPDGGGVAPGPASRAANAGRRPGPRPQPGCETGLEGDHRALALLGALGYAGPAGPPWGPGAAARPWVPFPAPTARWCLTMSLEGNTWSFNGGKWTGAGHLPGAGQKAVILLLFRALPSATASPRVTMGSSLPTTVSNGGRRPGCSRARHCSRRYHARGRYSVPR